MNTTEPKNEAELLSCPFCGTAPIAFNGDYKIVHSDNCLMKRTGIHMPLWLVGEHQFHAWNTRTPQPTQPSKDLDEVVDKVVNTLDCSFSSNAWIERDLIKVHALIKQACLSYSELVNADLVEKLSKSKDHERAAQKGAKINAEVSRKLAVSNAGLRNELEELTKIAKELAKDLEFCIKHGKFISSTGLNAFQTFTAKSKQ